MALSTVSAIVLAAGESKRMGETNKLLLPYQGKPVIGHVVETILQSDVAEVIVVVGHEQELIRNELQDYPVMFAENPAYEEGMGTSIRQGIQDAGNHVGYMVCLSDLPLITSEEYSKLVRAFLSHQQDDDNAITVPRFEGQRGNPVTLSSSYRSAMLSHQGIMGCRGIVKQHPEHVYFIDMNTNHVVYDIDTPEAYRGLSS